MRNGSNDWGVPFSHITWLENFLTAHKNITSVARHDDIVFEVDREAQGDQLSILCCREYTMGLALVQRGMNEFDNINIFYIGGGWCGYTKEAKKYCIDQEIGLFVTDEMSGALWKGDYWNYSRKDERRNPEYFCREED